MKPCVVVSSESGLDSALIPQHIVILPDRIVFSQTEEYRDSSEMDTYAFIMRMRLDIQAKPKIEGAVGVTVNEVLFNALSEGYDSFLFIMSEGKTNYYKPIVMDFIERNQGCKAEFYVAKSIGYPLAYIASCAATMLEDGASLEEILGKISRIDQENAMYLYSPYQDKIPAIEKFQYDEDVLNVDGNNNYFYMIHPHNVITYRVKERVKTIKYYLDFYLREIEGKDIIPFVLYTDKDSRYTKLFINMILKIYPKLESVNCYQLPPEVVVRYGGFACGLGYILKEKE